MGEWWIAWAAVVSGAILIGAGLRDMFHTLFHPAGTGNLSHWVSHMVWRLCRQMAGGRQGVLEIAGPLAMVTVIGLWAALQAFGWALVYWPWLPGQFRFASGIGGWAQVRFVDSLYASLVTLATLGYGDITPTSAALRLLAPMEALIGFAVLTAGLSWVLSTYPVLHRRSTFAQRVILAARTHSPESHWLTDEFAEEAVEKLSAWRSDLRTFPITFYFRDNDGKAAFPVALHLLHAQAKQEAEGSRAHGAFAVALADLTDYVAERYFGGPATVEAVIQRVVREHDWSNEVEDLPGSAAAVPMALRPR